MSDGLPPATLFDTAADRVLAAVPAQVAALLREFLSEPPREVDVLKREAHAYIEKLAGMRDEVEFLDLGLARRIEAQCQALLAGLDSDMDEHQLVQAAVRYFIEENDAEGDIVSLVGFDDDAQVIALVARAIGREEVLEITGVEP
jgi:uncharacterized membrane protein YkvA (DUF1232 family)